MTIDVDTEPKYPDVTVALVGHDSNAMAIVGSVSEALREHFDRVGMIRSEARAEADAFKAEAYGGDYDHLLRTCMAWVNVE